MKYFLLLVPNWMTCNRTLNGASTRLLQLLKTYHRNCRDFLDNKLLQPHQPPPTAVHLSTQDLESHFQTRRHKKLDRLLPPHRARRKRHFRRRRPATAATPRPRSTLHLYTVINLSDAPLSDAETKLLSRGLSFCPTPPKLPSTQLLDDLESYHRRLRLREFFLDHDEAQDNNDPRF